MNSKLKKKIIFYCSIAVLVIFCGIFYIRKLNVEVDLYTEDDIENKNIYINENNLEEIDEEKDEKENEVKEEEIYYIVHVAGEVKNPNNIYKLKKGSRVYDAIEKAGGTTEEANLDIINLAACIEDGQKIYVPNINDDNNELGKYQGNNEEINSNNNLININIASKIELMQLDRVGEKTAEKIVDYRTNVSLFKEIADIKNVSGIGDSIFNDIKDKICV